MDPRISVLPLGFLDNPLIVEGQRFVGVPKQNGSDNHAHTPEHIFRPTIYLDCTFDANGAAEALKFSRHFHKAIIGGKSIGGAEDCVDICRGGHLYFYQHAFERGGAKQDVTAKGGCHSLTFDSCIGLRKIVLGEYSKYDARAIYPDGSKRRARAWQLARPPVRGVTIIDCGVPVVECLHSETPTGNCAVSAKYRPFMAPYFWGRSILFKETNPAPGEQFTVLPEEMAA